MFANCHKDTGGGTTELATTVSTEPCVNYQTSFYKDKMQCLFNLYEKGRTLTGSHHKPA